MKHVLLFLTLVLMMPTMSADDETPQLTEKQIKLIQNGLFSGNHRSISTLPVAFLDQYSNTIRIECFSESELEIIVYNSEGDALSYDTISPYVTSALINAPINSGEYSLVILSSDIYAEGTFTIE